MKPLLLLLDVDGVLNIYGAPVPPPGFTDHDLFPEDDEPVRLSLQHGEWISEILSVVDIAWATGWNPLPTLLITTDPTIGLTRAAIDRVLTWAAAEAIR